jgi:hypothetical protein
MCGKTTMDKFYVCILMVAVALDEAMDSFVCDSISAGGAGDIGFNTQHKMSLLLSR